MAVNTPNASFSSNTSSINGPDIVALTSSDGSLLQALRTPSVFKTAIATVAGNTAVWTPAAGKKFRLMRFAIMLTENANQTAGAIQTISLQDAAADFGMDFSLFIPTAAATVIGDGFYSGWIDLGNGYLSSAANNALNVNLNVGAGFAGTVRVIACGTEE